MKLATAAYPLHAFEDWSAYETKLTAWVAEAAGAGAELLVFPEYAAMELATLGGAGACADLERASRTVSDLFPKVHGLHLALAARFGVHILGASGPVYLEDGMLVNRAHLYTPTGQMGFQDKLIMTLWERDPWGVSGLAPLKVFDTALGKIAVNICYDSEYPLHARAQRDAVLLLVPSCTEALEGYWRVRIGAMARALENQFISVMSSIVGDFPAIEAVSQNVGMGGVFGPPDAGFPPTGVLAEGNLNQPGWTYAEVDLARVAEVRENGNVRNRAHWTEQPGGTVAGPEPVELCVLK
ncbi:carbon-nitrogen hydrolase family protein [Pseudooceanicola sp. CBS1P-1]|uniref:Amidohydrolase n=1 Tax=Pseudooceanicola albus TaxID=2692189 RepID=A0A6L7G9Z0_9RHOB|nr:MULTISPECIES: carbon-nitrogen hydrolase family protein [Pseudooceanicola]MBT9386478.1 carbon-nitrogen hydrolase family protein [Pseudooceanicola endophyticus]MXN20512.1 amidohydrolase [Pseudooceanicola albus]